MKSYGDYIIVQAGGKGTRLKYLTRNRPKCLVPIDNRPMIFHLFELFPNSKFIIIGDQHFSVLQNYLKCFASVDYILVSSSGNKGTLAGISLALKYIPDNQPFSIIWSDLVLPNHFKFPTLEYNYIIHSKNLKCRWRFKNNIIEEVPSSECGISGFFMFMNKCILENCPISGQLVKYLSTISDKFHPFYIDGIKEYGVIEAFYNIERSKCRPFNKLTRLGNKIIKEPLTQQGKNLSINEARWYEYAKKANWSIPKIYRTDPLEMEYIEGTDIASAIVDTHDHHFILNKILDELNRMHSHASLNSDLESYMEVYWHKTIRRLQSIQNLVPFANDSSIIVNGRTCRNPLYMQDVGLELTRKYFPQKFTPIHGDPTFSNIILRHNGDICFIDPRGYFGNMFIFGDPAYDYAKLYYSLYGNYDNFNAKQFRLFINSDNVAIYLPRSKCYIKEDVFLKKIKLLPKQIHLFHALIWLSLTTYTWDDYDSICGAFYLGIKHWERALNEHNI